MKTVSLIAIGLAAALTPLAPARAATTGPVPTTTAVTPNGSTTSPGSSEYVNPYTPPAGVAAKSPSNPTDPPGSWEVYPSPTTRDLLAVDFVNANDGWAVGYYVILRYQGGTWSVYYQNTQYCFLDVDMVSADDGWLVCMNFNTFTPEIWRWDGSSWSLFQTMPGEMDCIDMINANDGWIGDNPTFKRFDGSSWVTDGSAPDQVYDIQMNSDTDGRAVAYNYIMRRSGTVWIQETSNTDWGLGDIFMVNDNVGWAGGYYRPTEKGLILKFAGAWSVNRIFTDYESITGLWAFSDHAVWAASCRNPNYPYRGVMLYYNGAEWLEVINADPAERVVTDFYFFDNDNGWALGSAGLIFKYKPNIAVNAGTLGKIKALYYQP